MKENLNYKLISLLMINRYLPFKFHIKITVSLETHGGDCEVVGKVVTELA